MPVFKKEFLNDIRYAEGEDKRERERARALNEFAHLELLEVVNAGPERWGRDDNMPPTWANVSETKKGCYIHSAATPIETRRGIDVGG